LNISSLERAPHLHVKNSHDQGFVFAKHPHEQTTLQGPNLRLEQLLFIFTMLLPVMSTLFVDVWDDQPDVD
jgi:hypothetical protein